MAQQIGGVIVVPVLALMFAQLAGVIAIGLETILIALVVLGAADYALVGVGSRLFQRETLLTRWRCWQRRTTVYQEVVVYTTPT